MLELLELGLEATDTHCKGTPHFESRSLGLLAILPSRGLVTFFGWGGLRKKVHKEWG